MKWIKKIKKTFKRNKNTDNQNTNNLKISNPNFPEKKKEESKSRMFQNYDYESYNMLKVYKRPIIKDVSEREQLFRKISKELEKLD
jgi:hypothetical protein